MEYAGLLFAVVVWAVLGDLLLPDPLWFQHGFRKAQPAQRAW
jgi:hypothetical protein